MTDVPVLKYQEMSTVQGPTGDISQVRGLGQGNVYFFYFHVLL